MESALFQSDAAMYCLAWLKIVSTPRRSGVEVMVGVMVGLGVGGMFGAATTLVLRHDRVLRSFDVMLSAVLMEEMRADGIGGDDVASGLLAFGVQGFDDHEF